MGRQGTYSHTSLVKVLNNSTLIECNLALSSEITNVLSFDPIILLWGIHLTDMLFLPSTTMTELGLAWGCQCRHCISHHSLQLNGSYVSKSLQWNMTGWDVCCFLVWVLICWACTFLRAPFSFLWPELRMCPWSSFQPCRLRSGGTWKKWDGENVASCCGCCVSP